MKKTAHLGALAIRFGNGFEKREVLEFVADVGVGKTADAVLALLITTDLFITTGLFIKKGERPKPKPNPNRGPMKNG